MIETKLIEHKKVRFKDVLPGSFILLPEAIRIPDEGIRLFIKSDTCEIREVGTDLYRTVGSEVIVLEPINVSIDFC